MKLRRRERDGRPERIEAASNPPGPNSLEPMVDAFNAAGAKGTWPVDFQDLRGLFGTPPGSGYSPSLVEKVGVANRCIQLAAQQIGTMPLRFRRAQNLDLDAPAPQWVANPDPAYYPNGISDLLFAAVWSIYQHGDAFLYVTSRYADGYPQTLTALDAVTMLVGVEGGRRTYDSNGAPLDPADVIQISRDPRGTARGTGALQSYAANLNAAYTQAAYASDVVASGGMPPVALRPARRVTADQAAELQAQWVNRAASRLGAPAVIPPDLAIEQFAWSPKDLLLLEARHFDSAMICGAFGTPPPMVGVPVPNLGLTYQTVEQLFDNYWRAELYPRGHYIAQALSNLALPRGNWVEFDPSVILKPSLPAYADAWLKMLNAQVVTEAEFRAAVLDLPPLEMGEALEEIDEPAGAQGGAQTADLQVVPREGVA